MSDALELRFGITPFYVTRQYYYALENGFVEPEGVTLDIDYFHSPRKDHVLVCGEVDASTISIGKYLLAKTISDTYALPTDPFAVAAGLTYENGNGLFVRADGDVDDPQDLVGKRLGIHDRSIALVTHKAVLEEVYDVPVDEIEWVFDTHQNLTRRMEKGDIDAVERVGDWYWNLRTSPEYTMLYDMAEEWHDLKGYFPIVHLVAVDRALYDAHPDEMAAFADALRASRDYRDDHYDEIIEAFATEASSKTEWVGNRSVEDIRAITQKARLPVTFGETQRRNVRDVMEYLVRYDVMCEPLPEERLYPTA